MCGICLCIGRVQTIRTNDSSDIGGQWDETEEQSHSWGPPWCSPSLLCMHLKVQGQEQHNRGTGRLMGGKGRGSPPVQLPSAYPPGLEEPTIVPRHPQSKKAFSFQSLKHPALENRSTATLETCLLCVISCWGLNPFYTNVGFCLINLLMMFFN